MYTTESGLCELADFEPFERAKKGRGRKPLAWKCTNRYRPLSDSDVENLVALKKLFNENGPTLKKSFTSLIKVVHMYTLSDNKKHTAQRFLMRDMC